MKNQEFYAMIDEIIDAAPGTASGDKALEQLPGWDSLAVLMFIAKADEHFGVTVDAAKLQDCKTVDDLAKLLGDRVAG